MKIILTLLFVVLSINAYAFCSEPSKPYCVSSYGNFNSSSEFESCKYNVERYVRDASDYMECLSKEINETQDEVKDVVNNFNNMAD